MTERGAPEHDAAALASAVLDEEARRLQAHRGPEVALPDDMLPGVGADTMSLKDALRIGGVSTVVVVGLAQVVEQINQTGFAVLAPNIEKSLHVTDPVLGAIGGAFGVLFVVGSIPVSSLADHYPRKRVAAFAIAVWSVVVGLTGFVQNAFQLFVARLGSGLGQSYQLPVNGPLLVDTYPIEARGRVFALWWVFQIAGTGLAPLFAGGIATLIPGESSWRWVFYLLAIVSVPIAIATARLKEPRRGQNEMRAALGDEIVETAGELPISLSVAFERLRKIKTFYYFLVGMAALGFALFSIPLFLNLLFAQKFGLNALQRGIVGSVSVIPGFAALAIVGKRSDALFRRSPPQALVFIGGLIGSFGVFIAVGVYMPNIALVTIFLSIGGALSQSAFAIVVAPISAIIPYRLRSRGIAMIGVYVFLFGSFFGAVATGLLSEAIGRQAAIVTIVLPSTIIGGALIAYGARYVRHDMSRVVEELQEEQAETGRLAVPATQVPVIQVRNLDFSYGKVQVLFDINLDVQRGETLALLGTNGAGKSTLLRVISGLGIADRGVVRLNGHTVTYADPELRVKNGIVQLIGGGATFPPLTVDENLRMAGFQYSRQELHTRMRRALDLFPALHARLDTTAADLSGGQQQILALAMTLMHDPEVLIIDELSLGLAPVVVQQILDVVRRLKDDGMTMIIVEQSLNVAFSIADRAIFMEKGEICFEGTAAELATRDDVARAVFLGR
ncbi:MAG: ATP-binding protein [Acidimicrobiia bacterium]